MKVVEILARLDECLIPDDREAILDFLEMLENKFKSYFRKKTNALLFMFHGGPIILLKVMKRMSNDEVVLRMGINIFDLQKKYNKPAILDFLKYGGLEILEKASVDHEEDLFLSDQIPPFRKSILNTGARVAVEEIEAEAVSLQLCEKCQETVERARRVLSSSTATKLPRSCDRVNRVLTYMRNFSTRPAVVKAGLDALIFFVKNADSRNTMHETTMIPFVCETVVPTFGDDPAVTWRAFFCLHVACAANPDLLYDVARYEVHEHIPDIYNKTIDPKVQQQLLWLLDLMVTNSKSRIRVHISEKCVNFVGDCVRIRVEKINKAGMSVKEKFKPYMCIVPLTLRDFYRSIDGKHLVVAAEREAEVKTHKERKRYSQKPRYGTVADRIMLPGEEGLLDEEV